MLPVLLQDPDLFLLPTKFLNWPHDYYIRLPSVTISTQLLLLAIHLWHHHSGGMSPPVEANHTLQIVVSQLPYTFGRSCTRTRMQCDPSNHSHSAVCKFSTRVRLASLHQCMGEQKRQLWWSYRCHKIQNGAGFFFLYFFTITQERGVFPLCVIGHRIYAIWPSPKFQSDCWHKAL